MITKEITIRLSDIDRVKRISEEASRQTFDIEILSKNCCVNCKSIIGILSLDLLKPVTCRIRYDEDKESVRDKVYAFLNYVKRFV